MFREFIFTAKKEVLVLFSFLIIISLYFIQLPLNGSLPGKIDNWFYVYVQEYLIEKMKNHSIGTSVYPESSFFPFGNLSIGFSIFYFPVRRLGLDVIWSFWWLTSVIYTLNAYGFYKLTSYFSIKRKIGFIGGLLFALSNYFIANSDNLDGLSCGFGLLSIYMLVKSNYFRKPQLLIFVAFLLGFQMYFSSYMFMLSGIVCAVYAMFYFIKSKDKFLWFRYYFLLIVIVLIMIFPFVNIYFFKSGLIDSSNPVNIGDADKYTNLYWKDLFRYLEGNILYGNIFLVTKDYWLDKLHTLGIGLSVLIMGCFGIWKIPHRTFVYLLISIGLLLSIGPQIEIFGFEIKNLLFVILNFFSIDNLFRINIRSFIIILFCVWLGWSYILNKIVLEFGYRKVFILVVFLAYIENIPASLKIYSSRELIDYAHEVKNLDFINSKDVVLNLPTYIYSSLYPEFYTKISDLPDSDIEAVIEHQYMLHQAWGNWNTINGIPGFLPKSRIKNQEDVLKIENPIIRNELLNRNNISFIILHKKFVYMLKGGKSLLDYEVILNEYDKVFDNGEMTVYKTNSIQ